MDLPEFGDLLIKQFQIWNLLPTVLKQDIGPMNFLLTLDLLLLGLIVLQELLEGVLGIDLPQVVVLGPEIILDALGIALNHVEVIGDFRNDVFDTEIVLDFREVIA